MTTALIVHPVIVRAAEMVAAENDHLLGRGPQLQLGAGEAARSARQLVIDSERQITMTPASAAHVCVQQISSQTPPC